MTKFQFGNIVVVFDDLIGVIVKSWENQKGECSHEVYVRMLNRIETFKENEIRHYVYSKELLQEQKEFYD